MKYLFAGLLVAAVLLMTAGSLRSFAGSAPTLKDSVLTTASADSSDSSDSSGGIGVMPAVSGAVTSFTLDGPAAAAQISSNSFMLCHNASSEDSAIDGVLIRKSDGYWRMISKAELLRLAKVSRDDHWRRRIYIPLRFTYDHRQHRAGRPSFSIRS